METILRTVTLEAITCYRCGVCFAMPQHMVAERRRDHAEFHCPNGHAQHFLQKSREEEMREQRDAAWESERVALAAKATAETAAMDAASKLKRERDRIAKGICPCCKRHFSCLARHIASKHPTYGKRGASARANGAGK